MFGIRPSYQPVPTEDRLDRDDKETALSGPADDGPAETQPIAESVARTHDDMALALEVESSRRSAIIQLPDPQVQPRTTWRDSAAEFLGSPRTRGAVTLGSILGLAFSGFGVLPAAFATYVGVEVGTALGNNSSAGSEGLLRFVNGAAVVGSILVVATHDMVATDRANVLSGVAGMNMLIMLAADTRVAEEFGLE